MRRRICGNEQSVSPSHREVELAHLVCNEQGFGVVAIRLERSDDERGEANDDDHCRADEDSNASAADGEAPDGKRCKECPDGDEDDRPAETCQSHCPRVQ